MFGNISASNVGEKETQTYHGQLSIGSMVSGWARLWKRPAHTQSCYLPISHRQPVDCRQSQLLDDQKFLSGRAEDTFPTTLFVFDTAQPPVLLGKDQWPTPVEFALHALATCLTTSFVYHEVGSRR